MGEHASLKVDFSPPLSAGGYCVRNENLIIGVMTFKDMEESLEKKGFTPRVFEKCGRNFLQVGVEWGFRTEATRDLLRRVKDQIDDPGLFCQFVEMPGPPHAQNYSLYIYGDVEKGFDALVKHGIVADDQRRLLMDEVARKGMGNSSAFAEVTKRPRAKAAKTPKAPRTATRRATAPRRKVADAGRG